MTIVLMNTAGYSDLVKSASQLSIWLRHDTPAKAIPEAKWEH